MSQTDTPLGAVLTAQDLSALEMSALFSNLARACDKMYRQEEAALYQQLGAYYTAKVPPAEENSPDALMACIDADLERGIPAANAAAGAVRDRGALRSLVWDEKVTRIQKSLFKKAQKSSPEELEAADYFVCTACGFIFQGDAPPQLCPVCKVPSWKFEKA